MITNFFAVFKNQSILHSIVQLFEIKKADWLISSSLKKEQKISSGAPKVNETLPVAVYVVRNKEKSKR